MAFAVGVDRAVRVVVAWVFCRHGLTGALVERAFGDDPLGKAPRVDQGEEGRFRRFTREQIKARGDNLDLTWLRDDSVERAEDLPEPEVIAAEILEHLRVAMEEMEALSELLEGDDEPVELGL